MKLFHNSNRGGRGDRATERSVVPVPPGEGRRTAARGLRLPAAWLTVHLLETRLGQLDAGTVRASATDKQLSRVERRLQTAMKSFGLLLRLRRPVVFAGMTTNSGPTSKSLTAGRS